jgi:hypothetical protein
MIRAPGALRVTPRLRYHLAAIRVFDDEAVAPFVAESR